MRVFNGWLSIEKGDTIDLSLDYKSIEEVDKHYLASTGRSFLHYSHDCAFCLAKYPVYRRFVAQVIYDGSNLQWEYGVIVQNQLSVLKKYINDSGFISIRISRIGKGPGTFYRCNFVPDKRWNDEINAENERRLQLFKQFHPDTP